MSLQDIYNKTVQEKRAREQKEKDLHEKDSLLCEETRKLYQIQPCEKGMYTGSLPVSPPPEMMKLVKELIALCPESEWMRLPKKPDLSTIHFFKGGGLKDKIHPERGYWPAVFSYSCRSYFQCKATDGSVHLGFWEIQMSEELEKLKAPFRITMMGRVKALKNAEDEQEKREKENFQKEIQSAFEEYMRVLPVTGEQDYIALSYRNTIRMEDPGCSRMSGMNDIVIFRDGTVYDPHQDRGSILMKLSDFQRACGIRVEEWAKLS